MNKIIDKVEETDDMLLLLEQHQKEIWEWKQKESQWIKDKNQLEGHKRIVAELSTRIVEISKVNSVFKKRIEEAEGEITIVKGIGMSSPEMRDAQDRIKELENSLSIALEINENHQRYNGKLQTRVTDLEEDNKKLTQQINDHIKSREDTIRKAGL